MRIDITSYPFQSVIKRVDSYYAIFSKEYGSEFCEGFSEVLARVIRSSEVLLDLWYELRFRKGGYELGYVIFNFGA